MFFIFKTKNLVITLKAVIIIYSLCDIKRLQRAKRKNFKEKKETKRDGRKFFKEC